VTAGGQKIGQFRAEAAGREIREPPHVVQRLIGRPGGNDAVHVLTLAAKGRKEHKNFQRLLRFFAAKIVLFRFVAGIRAGAICRHITYPADLGAV
jgi:hypothetical protein